MKRLSSATVFLYGAASFGSAMVYQFVNMAFPLYLRAYPVSNLVVGFLAQERSFVGAFVQPMVGAISDRLPPSRLGRRRPFFLIGVPLTAGSLLFLAGYPPLWSVLAVMTFFSFFLAVAQDPYLALLPEISAPEQRGLIGGVMAVFTMSGTILVIVVAFLFWDTHELWVFWSVAIGLIAAFAITFLGVHEPTRPARRPIAPLHLHPLAYVRGIAAMPALARYLAAIGFFWLGNGGVAPFLTRFAVQELGAPESQSFLIFLPAVLSSAVFAVPVGVFAGRVGKKSVLLAGMGIFALSAAVGPQIVQSLGEAMLLMPIVGIANAVTTTLIFPLLADLIPVERAGEFTGIGSLLWSLAQPMGALAAGAVADVTGDLRLAFATGGVAMFTAFVLLFTIHTPLTARPSD